MAVTRSNAGRRKRLGTGGKILLLAVAGGGGFLLVREATKGESGGSPSPTPGPTPSPAPSPTPSPHPTPTPSPAPSPTPSPSPGGSGGLVAPAKPIVVSKTLTSADVQTNAVSGATAYVFRVKTAGATSFTPQAPVAQPSMNITGLPSGSKVQIDAIARGPGGAHSPASPAVSVTL